MPVSHCRYDDLAHPTGQDLTRLAYIPLRDTSKNLVLTFYRIRMPHTLIYDIIDSTRIGITAMGA